MRDIVVEDAVARHREWSSRRHIQFGGYDRDLQGRHILKGNRGSIHLPDRQHLAPQYAA